MRDAVAVPFPLHTCFRALALLATVLLALGTQGFRDFQIAVVAIAAGHYLVGLYYSKRQLGRIAQDGRASFRLAGLVALGLALSVIRFPLTFYFGLHHVFNEVYMLQRQLPERAVAALRPLRVAGLMLHAFGYLAITRFDMLRFVPAVVMRHIDIVLLGGFLIACGAYATIAWTRSLKLSRIQWIELTSGEVATALWVALSYNGVRVGVYHVACYHFVLWLLAPAYRLWKSDPGELRRYLALTALISLGTLLASPLGPLPYALPVGALLVLFAITSNIHISISLALSSVQPTVLVRWFAPRERGQETRAAA